MKYVISSYGPDNIAVGLLDKESATEDINLSHNLHNINVNYNYYNGVLSFASYRSFLRYLINKEFIQLWKPNKTFSQVLREASNRVRSVINKEVSFYNFMPEIYHRERTYHVYKVAN